MREENKRIVEAYQNIILGKSKNSEEKLEEKKLPKLSQRIGNARMEVNNIVWDIKASGAPEFGKIKSLARSLDDVLETVQTRLRDMGD